MQTFDPKGSFLKNLALSLCLIGVTSLVIPIVLKQIDDRKFDAQQQYETSLAREDKIIDAQAALLDAMATHFWDYEQNAADVLYSRDPVIGREDWHARAVDAYYLGSGPLLTQLRADISTLLRLAPRSNYEAFLRLYDEDLLALDACLLELMKEDAGDSATCEHASGRFAGATWDELSTYVLTQGLAEQADQVFADLARDFRLHGVATAGE